MPEVPFYWIPVAIFATVVFGSILGSWLRRDYSGLVADEAQGPTISDIPTEDRKLDHPWLQLRLQGLLDQHQIGGSCNIRNGRVIRCERDGERRAFGEELQRVTDEVIAMTGNNPNLAIYTYREGKMVPLGNLTLADLLGLAMMLETKA